MTIAIVISVLLLLALIFWGLIKTIIHCYYKNHNRNKDAHKNAQREGSQHLPISEPNNLTFQQPNTQEEEPSLIMAETSLPQPLVYSSTVQVTEPPRIYAPEPEQVPLMFLHNPV